MEGDSGSGTPADLVVAQLDDSWIDRAGEILGSSFADEPGSSWSLGGTPQSRRRVLALSFRASLRARRRTMELHGAFLGDRLVGVGVRFAPGRWPATRWEAIRGWPWRLVGLLVRTWASRRSLRGLTANTTYRRLHRGYPPHWYLWAVGVLPSFRRQGVATALGRYVTQQADESRVGCYLETLSADTEALYRELGFEVQERFRTEQAAPAGRTMWRDPQPVAAPSSAYGGHDLGLEPDDSQGERKSIGLQADAA
jgi:ribosomal protein S18 acetylase RimI-like enzyme